MARKKDQPQRLLFVFAKHEKTKQASTLLPVMYIERTLEEVPHFPALKKEADQSGQDWDLVFMAGLLGQNGELPSVEDAERQMEGMVAAIQKGVLENMFCFDQQGQPMDFMVRH